MLKAVFAVTALAAVAIGLALPTPHAQASADQKIFAFEAGRS